MATNSHSVKYETLRFGHGPLVFLLYNLINKVHANIDTELCTRLNFFDLKTRQRKFSKVGSDNFYKTEMYHLNVTFSPPKS